MRDASGRCVCVCEYGGVGAVDPATNRKAINNPVNDIDRITRQWQSVLLGWQELSGVRFGFVMK